jgi:hypothetical protein
MTGRVRGQVSQFKQDVEESPRLLDRNGSVRRVVRSFWVTCVGESGASLGNVQGSIQVEMRGDSFRGSVGENNMVIVPGGPDTDGVYRPAYVYNETTRSTMRAVARGGRTLPILIGVAAFVLLAPRLLPALAARLAGPGRGAFLSAPGNGFAIPRPDPNVPPPWPNHAYGPPQTNVGYVPPLSNTAFGFSGPDQRQLLLARIRLHQATLPGLEQRVRGARTPGERGFWANAVRQELAQLQRDETALMSLGRGSTIQ